MPYLDVFLFSRRVLRSIRTKGAAQTFSLFLNALSKRHEIDDFDLKHGTDTCGSIPLWRMTIDSANASEGERYEAIPVERFRSAIGSIYKDFSSFTFIDLGCGKGRNLILAAQAGFASVIGVEFARELASVATDNLRKMNIRNATVVCQDVVNFRFPKKNLVVYMFNPFSGTVMERVIENLIGVARDSPIKEIYIVYHPPFESAIQDVAHFELISSSEATHGALIWKSMSAR